MADVTTLGIGVDSSGVRKATDDIDKLNIGMAKSVGVGVGFERMIEQATTKVIQLAEAFVGLGVSLGHYQDLAEQTNADPAGLASLQIAADVANMSLENVAMMMNRMTQSVSRAKDDTTGAGRALKSLGIDTKEFLSLQADQQYKLIAERLNQYADSSSKVALAQALFGRGGAQQLVMMKELASQGDSTNIITNEMIKRADDLTDAMTRQSSQTRQLLKVLSAEGLLGALSDAQTAFTEVAKSVLSVDKETGKLDATNLKKFADDAVDYMAFAADAILSIPAAVKVVGNTIGATAAMFNNFMTVDPKNLKAANDAVRDAFQEDLTAISSGVTKFRDALKNAREKKAAALRADQAAWGREGRAGSGAQLDFTPVKETKDKVVKEKVGGIPEYMKEYLKLTEAEDRFIQRLATETATMGMSKLQVDLYKISLQDLTDSKRKEATDLAIAMDTKRQELELDKERQKMLEDLKTDGEKLYEQEQKIYALFSDEVTQKKLLADANAKYQKTLKDQAKATDELDRFTVKAAENIENVLATGLADAMEGKFDRIDKAFLKMLNSMVANALAANISNYIFGDYGKTGKIGGAAKSLWDKLMGAAGGAGAGAGAGAGTDVGGYVGSDFIGGVLPFASGGRPPTGRPSLVGEKGPELFVPDSAGTVVPNSALGGRYLSVNQVINVGGGASKNDVAMAMAVAKQQAKSEIADMMSRGAFA
jgi:hypothetical protein